MFLVAFFSLFASFSSEVYSSVPSVEAILGKSGPAKRGLRNSRGIKIASFAAKAVHFSRPENLVGEIVSAIPRAKKLRRVGRLHSFFQRSNKKGRVHKVFVKKKPACQSVGPEKKSQKVVAKKPLTPFFVDCSFRVDATGLSFLPISNYSNGWDHAFFAVSKNHLNQLSEISVAIDSFRDSGGGLVIAYRSELPRQWCVVRRVGDNRDAFISYNGGSACSNLFSAKKSFSSPSSFHGSNSIYSGRQSKVSAASLLGFYGTKNVEHSISCF